MRVNPICEIALQSPPIHGAAEEVGPAVVAPHHGAVDLLQGSWQSQICERFRITRLQIVGVEDVVLATDEKDYLLIRSLVHGVHMIDARRQIEQPSDLRRISLIDPVVAYSP